MLCVYISVCAGMEWENMSEVCVCVCVCWVWVIERKGGKIELKRERAECGRLLSALSHAATQASIQTRPIHCPYGPSCVFCGIATLYRLKLVSVMFLS